MARGCGGSEQHAKDNCKMNENILRSLGRPNANVECLICKSDGCNGASQYGPIALLVALPVAIAKILKF